MRRLFLGVLLTTALSPSSATADALRCDSRLVSTGALAAEILGVCGEPVYRDAWLVPFHAGFVSDTEEWYYNFGPNQLLHILRLRNGRLVEVRSDGYGYQEPPAADCVAGGIVEGLSKFRLLLNCGEPLTRESYKVLRPLRHPHDGAVVRGYQQPVFREKWVYNFGSNYFLRLVTLENGRVVSVDNGARGFSR